MKTLEIVEVSDAEVKVALSLLKRKKRKPTESKKRKVGSFIDMFGGMTGYVEPVNGTIVSSDTK